ncbi:MAG: DUF6512 family protein [Pseudomonadota bacterium]|nr:DUF6512 family protein [Pseudomonadota bacterium]
MQNEILKKELIRWEVISFIWIVFVGGAMHEVYRQTGYWKPIALIAPVNESLWEHMKMTFWPALFIIFIQYLFIHFKRQNVSNFWLSKLVLLILSPILVFTTYVIYTLIVESMGGLAAVGPTAVLALLCAIISQLVCCRLIISENYSYSASRYIPIGYVLLIISFSSFTYFPPKIYLFEHHDNYKPNGQFGLEADREQSGRNRK